MVFQVFGIIGPTPDTCWDQLTAKRSIRQAYFRIDEDRIKRTFIAIDFDPIPFADGGTYFTVNLPANALQAMEQ